MKILQVVPYLFPAYGGPGQVVEEISKEMVLRGHQVVIYTTDSIDNKSRQKPRNFELHGAEVLCFRNISNALAWNRLSIAPGIIPQVRREISKFDVIHLHDYRNLLNIVVHHFALKNQIPYILQPHGSAATVFQRGNLKGIYDTFWGGRILRNARTVIALTQKEANWLEQMGKTAGEIQILPNGVATALLDNVPPKGAFRQKYGFSEQEKIVLFLGRISWIKGLELLVNSMADILKEESEIRLVIAGPDDGFLATLSGLIRKLGIQKKVFFTGPLYGQSKLEAYVDADIYVLPSVYEAFGITVLEACACGVPVVVTDRCGVAEFVNGKMGLVSPYDEKKLRETIIRLLKDEVMRKEFSTQCPSTVRENFTWSRIADKLQDLYRLVNKTNYGEVPGENANH
jgi:glycosyltransferase involved in cell wall biosynthesis